MLQGLRTTIYKVDDLAAAKEWYRGILETDPYFDEEFYVGFNVGGYELGLMPEPVANGGGKTDSVLAYWGVEDATAAFDRLLDHGATIHQTVTDVGEGILVATVWDPFGNVFGVIQNPHFSLP